MRKRHKRPQQPTEPELFLFSEEEMAEMLISDEKKPARSKPSVKFQTPNIPPQLEPVATDAVEAPAPVDASPLKAEIDSSPSTETDAAAPSKVKTVRIITPDNPGEPIVYDKARMEEDMLMAMDLFDTYCNASKVRLIAMESAALAHNGIHVGQIYELPAIPDHRFDGHQLTAIYYVSFARSFPSMIDRINLPFSDVYERALKRYNE